MYQSPEILKKAISETYGFKEDLIKNAELCGLWHVRFSVKNINYYGYIAHASAEPCIKVDGYNYKYYDHNLPVKEEYYKEFIENKQIMLTKCADPSNGDWLDTGIILKSQDEAKEYISKLDTPELYGYDFID